MVAQPRQFRARHLRQLLLLVFHLQLSLLLQVRAELLRRMQSRLLLETSLVRLLVLLVTAQCLV
jgi:hypothetical protein